jgi:biopolymer transport protein ExbB/TolQ
MLASARAAILRRSAVSATRTSTVHQINRLSTILLRSPLLWGSLLSVAFFSPIETGKITDPNVLRYFAGHWINYVETVAFFVALSALVLKAFDVARQLASVDDAVLSPAPVGGQTPDDCSALLDDVSHSENQNGEGYLTRRLRTALAFVARKGSPDTLDEEIKYLSDVDAAHAAQSYGLIKIIIWAIPILGFLGTVIGITIAIASLQPEQLEQSLPEVTGGLGVAFDTTALALGLSMVLMFVQYVVDKYEQRLLASVDRRMTEELVGRFRVELAPQDPLMVAVRRLADAILPNMERLVVRQSELWQKSMESAESRWLETTHKAGQQLDTSLQTALAGSLKQHAVEIASAEQTLAQENRRHWSHVQQALVATAEAIGQQQSELAKQGEVLLKVVEATDQVARLEETLNRNLHSLAGAKNFEETVVSLAAAIQLLSSRVGHLPSADTRKIELPRPKNMVQAA